MSTFTAFFAQNKLQTPNIKYVASKNFVDENGKPMEWELRKLSKTENNELIKACTKTVTLRDGSRIKEVDQNAYSDKLIAACVVFPPLKDAALQDSYHVVGEVNLLNEMLSIGEFANLGLKVKELNDLDEEINELVAEAKN